MQELHAEMPVLACRIVPAIPWCHHGWFQNSANCNPRCLLDFTFPISYKLPPIRGPESDQNATKLISKLIQSGRTKNEPKTNHKCMDFWPSGIHAEGKVALSLHSQLSFRKWHTSGFTVKCVKMTVSRTVSRGPQTSDCPSTIGHLDLEAVFQYLLDQFWDHLDSIGGFILCSCWMQLLPTNIGITHLCSWNKIHEKYSQRQPHMLVFQLYGMILIIWHPIIFVGCVGSRDIYHRPCACFI